MIQGYYIRTAVITRNPKEVRPQVLDNDRFRRTHARLIHPRDTNNNKGGDKK